MVARALIVDANDVLVLPDPLRRRPVVAAKLLEVLKGSLEPGPVRFAQHGHGVAEFEDGEEVLLFLRRIETHRELSELGASGSLRWVSLQEHDAKFPLTESSSAALLSAVHAYARAAALADPEEQRRAQRGATLTQQASPDARVAASAVRDLVASEQPLVPEDVPKLESIIAIPDTSIGVRIALLAELERRGMAEGPPRWVALLRSTAGADKLAVVRALAAHPSVPVTTELISILGGDDVHLASAAAVALGVPGNQSAVRPLGRALSDGDERLRMASIRGLGRIETVEARKALEEAAVSHPDPATRRRARAEVARLEPGS